MFDQHDHEAVAQALAAEQNLAWGTLTEGQRFEFYAVAQRVLVVLATSRRERGLRA